MTYKTLEKDYYVVLKTLTSSLENKGKAISRSELPYFLETSTLPRLKPARRWIISAISGSGKTTILKQFVSAGFHKLLNVTTRPARAGETNSDYIFVDKKTFLSWKRHKLLFHPHKRNGAWHAILKKDIKKLVGKNSSFYLDKSIASSLKLKSYLPQKINFTYIYILPPTFGELYKRILKRETTQKEKGGEYLSTKEIFNRFKEEIDDMKKATKLPYVYVVNDSLSRVKQLLHKTILASKPTSK